MCLQEMTKLMGIKTTYQYTLICTAVSKESFVLSLYRKEPPHYQHSHNIYSNCTKCQTDYMFNPPQLPTVKETFPKVSDRYFDLRERPA